VRELRYGRGGRVLPGLAARGLRCRCVLHARLLKLEVGDGLRTSLSLGQVLESFANPFVIALSMILAAEIFIEESPQRP
jgi:hypothetical protein